MVKRPDKYAIDISIPAANDTGADDQEPMRKNFENIKGFLTVDHVAPGTTNPANTAGKHKQITFDGYHPPAKLLDPVSIAYTNIGKADTSHPQHYWRSSQGIFPLSAIRAFGLINGALITPKVISGYNLGTVKESQATINKIIKYRFDIKVTANSVFKTTPALFVSSQLFYVDILSTYNENVISVFFTKAAFSNNTKFSVLLLQI